MNSAAAKQKVVENAPMKKLKCAICENVFNIARRPGAYPKTCGKTKCHYDYEAKRQRDYRQRVRVQKEPEKQLITMRQTVAADKE